MKQVATGMEKFSLLLFMSITSNLLRAFALTLLWIEHLMTPALVILIFIVGDVLELIVSMALTLPLISFRKGWNLRMSRYKVMIRESLPQAGVVICTALMARFDWMLMGILSSRTALAEYSFAWKAFEMATLPLLVVAPLMIPLFTRIRQNSETIKQLSFFLRWQVMAACLAALALNTAWNPLIDMVTDGKYGQVNTKTIFFLSLSMPILYCNNYLWTIAFALGRLKQIFFIMLVSLLINLAGCCLLVPLLQGQGAALAYLLTVAVQLALYIRYCEISFPISLWIKLTAWPALALGTGLCAKQLFGPGIIYFSVATGAFCAMVILSGKLRLRDWKALQIFYQ
jgi:O-antigen/teichoic acid export membrane protein